MYRLKIEHPFGFTSRALEEPLRDPCGKGLLPSELDAEGDAEGAFLEVLQGKPIGEATILRGRPLTHPKTNLGID